MTRGVVGEPLVEMGSKTVNKADLESLRHATALRRTRVMAFGDMPNDAEMLCWAGEGFRYAPGQLALIAKEMGRTCLAFHEDGVAQTIEAMLAERS